CPSGSARRSSRRSTTTSWRAARPFSRVTPAGQPAPRSEIGGRHHGPLNRAGFAGPPRGMSDGDFKSAAEFREVMDKVFTIMSTDPDMGPKLRDAQTPQRFEFPDVDMVVNITYAESADDGNNLRWEWSDAIDWEPEVEMTMDSEIANRYFQGKENIAMAIARRRIKTSGNVKKALALVPITKPVSGLYLEMLEAEYPHLVV